MGTTKTSIYKKPSTLTWVFIHIICPLLPIFIEGMLKFITNSFSINLDTFRSSTFSMSIGLLCIFVNQNLLTTQRSLSSDEERESMSSTAKLFTIYAICYFCFFAIIVVLSELCVPSQPTNTDKVLLSFKIIAFIACIVPIVTALVVQKSFKLRAVI